MGVGKTHIAQALGHLAVRQGAKVRFAKTSRIVAEPAGGHADCTWFALARGLQQAFLPHRLPMVPDIRTVVRYLPGTSGMDIGGDWYDVIPTDSAVCLVIGDVEGHSIAVAATMAQLRSAVRALRGMAEWWRASGGGGRT